MCWVNAVHSSIHTLLLLLVLSTAVGEAGASPPPPAPQPPPPQVESLPLFSGPLLQALRFWFGGVYQNDQYRLADYGRNPITKVVSYGDQNVKGIQVTYADTIVADWLGEGWRSLSLQPQILTVGSGEFINSATVKSGGFAVDSIQFTSTSGGIAKTGEWSMSSGQIVSHTATEQLTARFEHEAVTSSTAWYCYSHAPPLAITAISVEAC